MNPPPPITPAERWLCLALALLWSGAAAWVFAGPYGSYWMVGVSINWAFDQWSTLRAALLPALSVDNALGMLSASGLVGVALLLSQYLAYLIGLGRWLKLRSLWFWTWFHALLAAVYPATLLVIFLPLRLRSEPHQFFPDVVEKSTVALVVLLSIAFASYRLWRVRRRMEDVGER